MLSLAIFSILIGMVLAQRFKVLILVPAIGSALIIVSGLGLAGADDGRSIFMIAILVTAGLQIGYLGAAGVRYVIAFRTGFPPARLSTSHAVDWDVRRADARSPQ